MSDHNQPPRLSLKDEYGGLDLSMKKPMAVSPLMGGSSGLQTTPCRPLPAAAHFLTPDTPTGSAPRTDGLLGAGGSFKKEFYSPPEAGTAASNTLFRPWDTPESLSPTSDEAASSPSSSLTQCSPEDSSKLLFASSSPPDDAGVPNRSPPTLRSGQQEDNSPPLHPPPITFTIQPLVPFMMQSKPTVDNLMPFKYPTTALTSGQQQFKELSYSLAAPHPLQALENLTFQPVGGKRKRAPEGAEASPLLAKKSRAGSSRDGEPCGVCGEPSTGQHYGAAVCEGCKGFFRRRVVYRDIGSLVCGRGGCCPLTGRERIHCKSCRWQRCLAVGMRPQLIRSEPRSLRDSLPFTDFILALHKESTPAVPAIFLGRQHAQNLGHYLATRWPPTADLSHGGAAHVLRFISGLPGFGRHSPDQQRFAHTVGLSQVMLVRLLARFRPEVRAFLFPCGQFVLPAQMDLPEVVLAALVHLAADMACRGLTSLDLALMSCLLCCDPCDPGELYEKGLESLVSTSSSASLLALVLSVEELFRLSPASWGAIRLKV